MVQDTTVSFKKLFYFTFIFKINVSDENYQQMPDFQFPVQNFDFTNQFEFTTPINGIINYETYSLILNLF